MDFLVVLWYFQIYKVILVIQIGLNSWRTGLITGPGVGVTKARLFSDNSPLGKLPILQI